jgi:pimeloyl-ACP methyl ester carboxylesterase
VVRRLLDALEVPRAAVVGNSLGGRVALELASRAPDRVTGVGLLGAAIPGYRVRAVLGLARVVPPTVGRIPFPLGERWMQPAIRRLFGNAKALPDAGYAAAADEFVRVYRDPAARVAFFDSLRHLVSEPARPFWARMRRIRVPALVLWGTRDRLVPVRLASRLADTLPAAEMILLPGVGHVPQFEAPAETTGALARFLAAVEPGAGL